jgi:large conductance mechanosensitive channel
MANGSDRNNDQRPDERSPRSRALAEARAEAAKAKTELAKARAAEAKARTTVLTKTHADGFMNFVREQGIVGLAVGLALGTAAGASVKTIVDQFISPIVALLTRGVDLNSLKWVITPGTAGQKEVAIGYGTILSSFITLLATAFVIYLIIHLAKLDRIDKKKAS